MNTFLTVLFFSEATSSLFSTRDAISVFRQRSRAFVFGLFDLFRGAGASVLAYCTAGDSAQTVSINGRRSSSLVNCDCEDLGLRSGRLVTAAGKTAPLLHKRGRDTSLKSGHTKTLYLPGSKPSHREMYHRSQRARRKEAFSPGEQL